MNNWQSQSNKEKSTHGVQNDKNIESLLKSLQEDGVITSFEKDVHVKKNGFEYPQQYRADYLITTFDGKYIVVRRTTSHRDRVKMYSYDMQGVLENSAYSNNVVASIYLLPNTELNNKTFLSFRERVFSKIEYSPFTHSLVHDEFRQFLENLRSSTIEKIESLDAEPFIDEQQSLTGSESAKQGISFEKSIVSILNNEGELQKYKHGVSDKITALILDHLSAAHGITKTDIHSMRASDTVKHLITGGQSKTDFFVSMATKNGEVVETFSAKNTSKTVVSCHEYDHTRFAKILKCQGSKLEDYLRLFQKYGGYRSLAENLPAHSSLEEFKELLSEKRTRLAEWALSGRHDYDNIVDPTTQIARHLIIKHNDTISCSTIQHYMDKLGNNISPNDSNLGTSFVWTYPSGRKGRKIQLKLPVLI